MYGEQSTSMLNSRDVTLHFTDFLGQTPLRVATENEQEEIVNVFLIKFHNDGRPEDYLALVVETNLVEIFLMLTRKEKDYANLTDLHATAKRVEKSNLWMS